MGFGGITLPPREAEVKKDYLTRLNQPNKLSERLQGGEDNVPLNCLNRPKDIKPYI